MGEINELGDNVPVQRENFGQTAKVLVSQEGNEVLKRFPTLLDDLDCALTNIEVIEGSIDSVSSLGRKFKVPDLTPKNSVEVGKDGTLERFKKGGQSIVYVLHIGENKYIVKKHSAQSTYFDRVTQLYTNEMRQIQAMKRDIGAELNKEGVGLPTFIFASERVSCVIFEEGEYPKKPEDIEKITKSAPIITRYISERQKQNDPLWSDVYQDLRPDNFIKRPDGRMVFIDPVFKISPNKQLKIH